MSKGYKAGEVIQTAFKPFFRMLKGELKGKRCENCFESGIPLLKCKGCGQMYYCDKTCQTIDWSSVHASECHLDYFKNPPKTNIVKIDYLRSYVLRLWAHLKRNPGKKMQPHLLYDDRIITFLDILRIEEGPYKDPCLHTLAEEMTVALQKEGIPESECSHDLLRKLGTLWDMYSHPIPNEMDTCYIGTGIYIQPFAFNHSCVPTAFANLHERGFMEMRAIAPIPKGSLPTISLFHPYSHIHFSQRSVHLITQHRIHCLCPVCSEERANGDLINYCRLRSLMEGQVYVQNTHDYLLIHDELLSMLRHIYHEFDPRITFRYLNAVICLNKFKAPYPLMEKLMDEAEAHLLITKGTHHYEYRMLLRERETAKAIEQERRRLAVEFQRKQRLAEKSRVEQTYVNVVKDDRDVDEILKELELLDGDNKKDSSEEDQSKGKKKRKRNNKNKKKGKNVEGIEDKIEGQRGEDDAEEDRKDEDDDSKGDLDGDKESKAKKRRERKKRAQAKKNGSEEGSVTSEEEKRPESVQESPNEEAEQLRTEAYRRKNIPNKVAEKEDPPTREEMEELFRLLDEIAPSVEFKLKITPCGRLGKLKVD